MLLSRLCVHKGNGINRNKWNYDHCIKPITKDPKFSHGLPDYVFDEMVNNKTYS